MSITVSFSSNVKNSKFILSELDYYFNRLSEKNVIENDRDADLTIEIVPTEDTNDWIDINFSNGYGSIKANSQIALMIAVYRLFKEMGVRYLRPGRAFEAFPELPISILEQKIKVTETAAYPHRGVCIEGATSFENVKAFIDWLPKINMNSFFIQFENPYTFLKRWYEHELNPYLEHEEFSIEIAQAMSDEIDRYIALRGLIHHRVGHGWTSEVLGYSSKYGWEREESLPIEKQPLVAELNGKRDLFQSAPLLTSLDFANPVVNQKMIEQIVDYAESRPDVDVLHVWLSDASNNVCECSECKKELVSDQYVRLLNSLDEALTAKNLSSKICFLLYHELLLPPSKEVIANPDRFTMMFAPISRTFEKSYADVDYQAIPTIPTYERNKMVLPNSLEKNLAYLFEWQKVFDGDSFVYDYPLGRAHYGDQGYIHISQIIHRDIQHLDKLGLNGYISCQELRVGFPHNLPNYVMGEVLWNPNKQFDALKCEYFEAMYGLEWQQAVTYLENLSAASSVDYFNALGDRENLERSHAYANMLHESQESLKFISENCAKQRGRLKAEWLQLSHHREYVIKLATALMHLSNGELIKSEASWLDFLDYIRRQELATQRNLDVYRVIEVACNYAGFKQFDQ